MPNKTIYVREGDLPLWEKAQAQLGDSISTLFAQFLRERTETMDAFVHILHSTPPGSQHGSYFAVMFAPASGAGAMKPRYVHGTEQLQQFLREIGFTQDAVAKIQSDLKKQRSVAVRTALPLSAANHW